MFSRRRIKLTPIATPPSSNLAELHDIEMTDEAATVTTPPHLADSHATHSGHQENSGVAHSSGVSGNDVSKTYGEPGSSWLHNKKWRDDAEAASSRLLDQGFSMSKSKYRRTRSWTRKIRRKG